MMLGDAHIFKTGRRVGSLKDNSYFWNIVAVENCLIELVSTTSIHNILCLILKLGISFKRHVKSFLFKIQNSSAKL